VKEAKLDAEAIVLELLADPRGDNRVGRGSHYLWDRLKNRDPAFKFLSRSDHYRILWSLFHRGLVFLDIDDSSPDNWNVVLTERGRAAASAGVFDPDVATPYVRNLRELIPADDPIVLSYAEEAHRSYESECYFAAVVMLGVASEVALLGLFDVFGRHLDHLGTNTFSDQINRKKMFADRFAVFRRFWTSTGLPDDIKENSDVWINAAAEAIRKHRNDAGHAVATMIDQSTAHMLLSIFPEYLGKVYEVKRWLVDNTPSAATTAEDSQPVS
jgi:hypothetical protein